MTGCRVHFLSAIRNPRGGIFTVASGYQLAYTAPVQTLIVNETETRRIEALRRYQILDTPPDGNFDGVTALAAKLLKVPIALTTLVDTDRIWFKSRHGLDVEQIDRDPGLCASAILDGLPYVVNDARFDPRTLTNPLVAGEFGLRFYAAVPLCTHDNHRLGTLCVIDQEPREFGPDEVEILTALAGIVMDQMELRIASRAIAEKNAELAELNAEKDGFLATAAHDLRNPLNSITLMGELLKEQNVGPLNEPQAEMIAAVCESSEFMLKLVNDYLEFSSIGSGRILLDKQFVDPAGVIETCLKALHPIAIRKSILLTSELQSDLPELSLDPARIRQALANLIDNAIKFTPPGGTIVVRSLREADSLKIEVSDDGPGIVADELGLLFKPFSPTSTRPTGDEKSTGLGLSIAKRLTEAHGGSIGVRSTPGMGTTFFISLPLIPS